MVFEDFGSLRIRRRPAMWGAPSGFFVSIELRHQDGNRLPPKTKPDSPFHDAVKDAEGHDLCWSLGI
jgi:hypothetical protein